MLEQLITHIHNRFEQAIVSGAFEVSDGELEQVGLQDGQWFWVEGSVFNDGLHRQGDTNLADETFDGKVYLLAIPKAVIDLADEIGNWCEANAEVLSSPYQSESFDGYSYSKGGNGDGSGDIASWQAHFASRLNPWRKISW